MSQTVRALQWFGFRQTIRGAIIIGLISGGMLSLQGYAYVKLYPDKASQVAFAKSLQAAPSLGVLYGDSKDLLAGPNGYMAYRVVLFMSFIVSVWGLVVATKILRGNEEDGRLEVLRSGNTSARAVTTHSVIGFAYSLVIAWAISTALISAVGQAPDLQLPLLAAITTNLAIFMPAALFIGFGVYASQLALTRRRALFYGLFPILVFYILRAVANTIPGYGWLMSYTPFGWTQMVSPIVDTRAGWLLPSLLGAILFAALGIFLSDRDLGSSIIPERQRVRSHYHLLGSGWQLSLRQNSWVYVAWAGGASIVATIIASIIDVAAQAVSDSNALSQSIAELSGNHANLVVAFLSAGLVFTAMILMIMATTIIGSIRSDEARQYLDNILTGPHRRSTWLASRLVVGVCITLLIALLSGLITYSMASSHNVSLELSKVLADSAALTGTIVFLIGLGTLAYGLIPRFAVVIMYIVIGWSFTIDLASSVVHLNDIVKQSSLFHYLSFNLADWPDWGTLGWLVGLGLAMAVGGTILFTRRDIVIE